MAERNLLAYFKSEEEAKNALRQMRNLRIADSSVRRIDGYPGDGIDHIDNPITSDFPGLGYLTLDGDFSDRNASVLAAASVSASGMSTGGPDNQVTGRDVLLTVVVDEQDYDQAARIAAEGGAAL